MCFAPQRHALFRHLNLQKWSETLVFLTFWLRNVLRATMACNCSSLIWPDGSAPAALASLLFDPPEPQIIGKTQYNTVNRDFPTFSRICIFFLLTLSLLWPSLFYSSLLFSVTLPISTFHLSILSEVWLLNFLRLNLSKSLILCVGYTTKFSCVHSFFAACEVRQGIPQRCRMCCRMAKQLLRLFGAQEPGDVEEMEQLPGWGPRTKQGRGPP